MPYIITEPTKISGTQLGYAIYPFQKHFLDREKHDESPMKLYIFKLKDSEFIEVEKPLFQKDIPLSLQSSKVVESTLKDFIMHNEQYITNIDAMAQFFENKVKKR